MSAHRRDHFDGSVQGPTMHEGSKGFGTDKIPESYVIDKTGQLRMRFVNVHPWDDERIHRYLETLANE